MEVLHESDEPRTRGACSAPSTASTAHLDQAQIAHAREPTTGLTVYSLYGETRRPTKESLAQIDTLVFDIQDIGCRFYTYVSTMGHAMEAAAEHRFALCRARPPQSARWRAMFGPGAGPGSESFVGFHAIPLRHGMTIGELARMFSDELRSRLDLT